MRMKALVLNGTLLMAITMTAVSTPQRAQQAAPENCEDYDRVSYTPITGTPSGVTVTTLPNKAPGPTEFNGIPGVPSPHGTATYFLRQADMTQRPPWNSSVFVFGNKARLIGLRIDFRDHANGGIRAAWINDKLLSLKVWNGRIVSTDLILDIEKRSFIYSDSAGYGYGAQVRPNCVNR